MTQIHRTYVLLLLVVYVLLTAGCLVSINGGKDNIIYIPLHPITSPTSPTPSVKPTLSIYDQPSIYWIKIDPITDKRPGEIFIVNSTTNLSAGNEILVQIYKTDFHSGRFSEEFHGIVSTVNVKPGRNGINTISFIVNSSELYPNPRKYNFIETAINENATGLEHFNII